MIIDSCMFFQEIEMLKFRINLLWDYVDKFVVVEADRTHSGKLKPYNLPLHEFEWAKEKLVYYQASIEVCDLNLDYRPEKYEPDAPQWKIENRQRNAILDACKYFPDDAILMISDCDEIPSREVVEFRKHNLIQHPMSCQQQVSVYNLKYICPIDWRGTTIATLKQAREITPQGMRDMRNRFSVMPRSGWHLSYFGGADKIKSKIESFAHQEYNKEPLDMEKVNEAVSTGGTIFPDGTPLINADMSLYPEYFIKLAPESWL